VSVRLTTLPSGLRVVTDASGDLRTASLGVFVAAGSRHESEGEHGLSHLLEHMAFKGTARRNARAIAETIENVGGDLNAETSVEQTAYFARVLGEDVDLALDVIADIPRNWRARRTSSCRRSARSRTRPTIWSSISSQPPPGRISRSAGRSSAHATASAGSIARRSPLICAGTIGPARRSSPRLGRSITIGSSRAPNRCWRPSAPTRPNRRRRPPIAAARRW